MLINSRTTGGIVDIRVTSGGAGYASPPAVTISGGGGTGASAVAVMAGTRVDSVIITNSGTGYTGNPSVAFAGTSGAAASAYAYTGSLRPMSFFKGRLGTVYGVDGMGRGIRWDGVTSKPIGLHKPAAPVITAQTTSPGKRISAIQLVDGGRGYSSAPSVVITGGTPTTPAEAQAVISNGRVIGVRVSSSGRGYQSTPSVSFSGGIGTGGSFNVGVNGGISDIRITSGGTDYVSGGTLAPTITVSDAKGLSGFNAVLTVSDGRVVGAQVLSSGTGATTTPTLSVSAGTGSGASITPVLSYTVSSVTVSGASSGTGYFTPPIITIRPHPDDNLGNGAELESAVNASGNVTGVTVISGGRYLLPPSAVIQSTAALAQPSMTDPLRGEYLCAIRYIDDTPQDKGGPLPSSISHLVTVNASDGKGRLEWAFSHPYVDDRVTAMELWRTSGDQRVLLFRVATIKKTDPGWNTTYTDDMGDNALTDATRDGYGLMPITLPAGLRFLPGGTRWA